jgi:SmpA / OmlA family
MKRFVPVLVAVFVLGVVAVLCVRAFSDPVPAERLQRLQKGMTQDEVRSVLGPPTRVYDGQWTYQRPLVFGFVNIHWQTNGTYDGEVNYERF